MRLRWFYIPRMQFYRLFRVAPFWFRREAIGLWGRIGWRYWSLQLKYGDRA